MSVEGDFEIQYDEIKNNPQPSSLYPPCHELCLEIMMMAVRAHVCVLSATDIVLEIGKGDTKIENDACKIPHL